MDKIKYSVDFGKRKNFYITVSKGEVAVKAPFWANIRDVEEIVEKKKEWIISNVQKSLRNFKPQRDFSNDDEFFILGERCQLSENFYEKKRACFQKDGNVLNVFLPIELKGLDNRYVIEKCFLKWYRDFAKGEIFESFYRMQKLTGIMANKLTVRKMTRSWGRCSFKGDISINIETACYCKKSVDYVILHELCHIIYFNHSKEFWGLVEKFMPDYKVWKKKLNEIPNT